MPNFRRVFVPGGIYFFTVVAEGRQPLFLDSEAVQLFGNVLRECKAEFPFTVEAIVVLPDHLHAIWSLPPGDSKYAARWGWIKKEFTKRWLSTGHEERLVSSARSRERRRGIWQPRFWEHCIKDEDDFDTHFDYVHFNPVKHGYVRHPHEWPHTSFHRWVEKGVYDRRWACDDGKMPDFSAIEGEVGE